MAIERTFSMIKPDATARNQTGRNYQDCWKMRGLTHHCIKAGLDEPAPGRRLLRRP